MTPAYRRILITGANGLLGQSLVTLIGGDRRYDVLATARDPQPKALGGSFGYTSLDIGDRAATVELLTDFAPDVVINAAAMTHVDKCETDRESCWRANVEAVEHLVAGCRRAEAKLVHVSTDYVFDGVDGPYTEGDRPNPLGYYGKSKLAGENAVRGGEIPHAIARTMVLYGHAEGVKKNFALWLVDELSNGRPVRIVEDQIGNPTLVDDLAQALFRLAVRERTGLYHVSGREICSRYTFARRLAAIFGYDESLITPIQTRDLNQPAPRPLNSGFIVLKAETELGMRLSSVDEGLIRFKRQLKAVDYAI